MQNLQKFLARKSVQWHAITFTIKQKKSAQINQSDLTFSLPSRNANATKNGKYYLLVVTVYHQYIEIESALTSVREGDIVGIPVKLTTMWGKLRPKLRNRADKSIRPRKNSPFGTDERFFGTGGFAWAT